MQSGEVWLPVLGYEGLYEVSDQGGVRSLDRVVSYGHGDGCPHSPGRRFHRGVRLKPYYGQPPMRYLAVRLSKGARRANKRVHVLMLEAFRGPRPAGMVACHNNDQPHDLRIENLRWDTRSSNTLDTVAAGNHVHARKTHCKRGHLFDSENTYFTSTGGRCCRQCIHIRREAKRSASH